MKARMIMTVLVLEAFLMLFAILGAHPLLKDGQSTQQIVGGGLGLFAIFFVAAGFAKRPRGELVGWLAQLVLVLSGFWFAPMFFAAPFFIALYWWLVRVGKAIDQDRARIDAEATK